VGPGRDRRPLVPRLGLLLPGDIDHEIIEDAGRAGFGRLLDTGVKIYEYQAG
jgi:phosphatidylserine/phosphatidylglycerophosphate/cardiolipin synthase-like enzyme